MGWRDVMTAVTTVGLVLCWGCGGMPEENRAAEELPLRELESEHRSSERSGETRWVRRISSPGFEAGKKVAVDRDGNSVVFFLYQGAPRVGSTRLPESTGSGAYGLAKYDAEGRLEWVRGFVVKDPPPLNFATLDITTLALDEKGNIYFAGNAEGEVDFGGGPVRSGRFIVKLSPSGRFRWQIDVEGDTLRFFVTGIAIDSEGDIVVGGYFFGTIDLGGGPLGGGELVTAFLAKLSPEGRHRWSFSRMGDRGMVINGLALDCDDTIYLAVGLDWANDNDLRGGGVARVSPEGVVTWLRELSLDTEVTGIAVDDGRIVAVGDFFDEFVFAGRTVEPTGARDVFVIAYDTSGRERWLRHFGDGNPAVAMDGKGKVGVTGSFTEEDVIDDERMRAPGSFVVKLDSDDGDFRWTRTFTLFPETPPFNPARAIQTLAATPKGELVLTGAFVERTDFGPVAYTPRGTDMFLLKLAR